MEPARGEDVDVRHRPEETVLHRTVKGHWPAFLERAEEHGGLPRIVVREVEEYLRRGLLQHGCVRVACCSCAFERLVAFSCKRRGYAESWNMLSNTSAKRRAATGLADGFAYSSTR